MPGLGTSDRHYIKKCLRNMAEDVYADRLKVHKCKVEKPETKQHKTSQSDDDYSEIRRNVKQDDIEDKLNTIEDDIKEKLGDNITLMDNEIYDLVGRKWE